MLLEIILEMSWNFEHVFNCLKNFTLKDTSYRKHKQNVLFYFERKIIEFSRIKWKKIAEKFLSVPECLPVKIPNKIKMPLEKNNI